MRLTRITAAALLCALLSTCRATESKPAIVDAGAPALGLHFVSIPPRAPSGPRAPALVLVHGLGANERDLVGITPALDPRLALFSLRAPRPRGPDAFSWYDVTFTPDGPVHDRAQAEAARQQLVTFLRTLRARPDVDPDRVYLLGFSQGAILGLAVALTEPELLHGLVAISGRTLPEIAEAVRGHPLAHAPEVLVLHGNDDPMLAVSLAHDTERILTEAHVPVVLQTHPGGHAVSSAMLEDVKAWFAARLGP